MKKTIKIYKKVSQTPLQAIIEFKKKHKRYKKIKMAYAGRLDPMAEGLLLLLLESETKNREDYQALDKTYICEFVLGLQTDTYDILGILNKTEFEKVPQNWNELINNYLYSLPQTKNQKYPPFSSKTYKGKKLFEWFKEGLVIDSEIKNINIYSVNRLKDKTIALDKFEKYISNKINKVDGDFRQKEILSKWSEFFEKNKSNEDITIIRFKIKCSSGTYIREIVNNIGLQLNCGGLTWKIIRTKIGSFTLQNHFS